MKVKKLLELQALIEDKDTPNDLELLLPYYSKSSDKILNILDMELTHLVRAFSKQDRYSMTKTQNLKNKVSLMQDEIIAAYKIAIKQIKTLTKIQESINKENKK
tara:strand:- start:112 stop:423 length:312 start_codon:yes stop_codon:yes gene_type:complete